MLGSPLQILPPLLFLGACASAPIEPKFVGAAHHERPLVEEEGRTLLWAGSEDWFDVTDSSINPASFQYGIGRDTIPSIDEPNFVASNDPRLDSAGVTLETMILGVFREGQAKAYPVFLMDSHEVVNDTFGDESYAVLW
ncbi:MAG: hypothetical protein ACI9F9_000551 [Candidatus Paceibacteria bacterium]|jgi:hypothetical protein